MSTKKKKPSKKTREPGKFANVNPLACPSGHKLPRSGCTPVRCAEADIALPVVDIAEAKLKPPATASLEDEFAAADVAFQLRARRLGLPTNPTEEESEEWAEERLNKLRATVVADAEWDLKYGDSQARREARRDILAATGMKNREQLGNITPSIVVNIGTGSDAPKWLQRAAMKELAPDTVGPDKKEGE